MIFFIIFELDQKHQFMRTLTLTLLLLGTLTTLKAQQSVPMYKGAKIISVGIGYPSLLATGWEDLIGYQPYALQESTPSKGPVIQISAGKGLGDYFSLSIFLAFAKNTTTETYTDYNGNKKTEKYTDEIRLLGLRGQYHLYDQLNVSGKLDPYMSIAGGIKQTKESLLYGGNIYGIFYGLHAGTKYYLSDKVALYGEIGIGTALFNTGLSIRL